MIKQTPDTDLGDAKQVSVPSPTHLKMTHGESLLLVQICVLSLYQNMSDLNTDCRCVGRKKLTVFFHLQVAIKHIPKSYDDHYLVIVSCQNFRCLIADYCN